MAPTEGGTEASKRMHEYLLSKQRKQEEFWLRKYGKVLQTTPPSLGRPGANPRLPATGAFDSNSDRSSNAGLSTESSSAAAGGLLPPIPGAARPPAGPAGALPPHHRQPKGQAPIFHAKEPVRDFFSRNVRPPPRASAAAGAAPPRDEFSNLPPVSHLPPEPYRKGPGRPGQLPPLGLGGERSYGAAGQAPHAEYSAPQLGGEDSDGGGQHQADVSPRSGSYHMPPQQASAYRQLPGQGQVVSPSGALLQQQPQRAPQRGMVGGMFHGGGRLPPLSHEPSGLRGSHGSAPASSPYQNKPLRNLELELTVIKAIKAREDVLERLRVAGAKLDNSFGGSVPVVLSSVDPLVRLFYRLVSSLRQRTLDAVEAIAAWRRKLSPGEPFIYYGVDYLANIGPDASFLDDLPFLRSRLSFGRAADDPFLAELTPDGVPIEEATTCDLRRGGQRFSSDALRIRMARKVLAKYCGRSLPNDASAFTLDADSSTASGLPSGLPPIPSAAPRDDLAAEPSQPQGAMERPPEAAAAAAAAMGRLSSPQVAKAPAAALPPLPRAITPPAMSSGGVEASVSKPVVDAEPYDLEPLEEAEEEREREDDQAIADQDAEAASAEAAAQPPRGAAPVQPEDLLVFEDDGDFIDFALGAIIHSLEPPFVDAIEPGTFTVAGWEIDRQLEEVVGGLPSRAGGRVPSPPKPIAGVPPSRGGLVASLPKPPSRGGRIPAPPESFKPPSRGGVDGSGAARPSSRGLSRIPAPPGAGSDSTGGARPPVRVHLRPGSRGVGMDISMDGECFGGDVNPDSGLPTASEDQNASWAPAEDEEAANGASQPRPPVRVHLRPRNSGVGMDVSMDGEELAGAGPENALPVISEDRSAYFGDADDQDAGDDVEQQSRPPVRVHLRPGSRGVGMDISMDGEDLAGAGPASGLPAVSEDRSAYFGEAAEQRAGGDVGPQPRPPVRVHLKPRNSGVAMDVSMDGEDFAGAGPASGLPAISEDRSAYFGDADDQGAGDDVEPQPRPPVRVHLRPGSRSVAVGLSMDGEAFDAPGPAALTQQPITPTQGSLAPGKSAGYGTQGADAPAPPGARPPVRVHLRPGSQGVDMGLSMDGESFDAGGAGPAAPRASVPVLQAVAEAGDDGAGTPNSQHVASELEGSPSPLQGSLSARGNRAGIRSARGASRQGSAVAASREGLPMAMAGAED